MGSGVSKKKLRQNDYIVIRDKAKSGAIKNIIFPSGIQVGLKDSRFKAGIRIFGQIDTSDDILLFGNSIAAAVLDIDLNPSSVVVFGDPADKEVFIQPATITADAAYSGHQMKYDGLARSDKNVTLDYSYRPFFAGITGDNGIASISNVVVNAPTGSVKNPLTGSVKLTDTHGTMFMTLDFASDASTGDLTIQPNLNQIRTNNKEITNITLKIPFAAKSNNPKPLITKKEVHIQKLEFPAEANYFTTPSVYVLRKNSSNQFSTLDLAAVPYSVNYVEGYNYGSGATEVSASNLIPNATGSVGSVNTLANGSFTIKSVRDLFCSSSSASTMVQPATTGSDRYKVRLTALSGADDNATFAAREIETLYKTTTGLVGSDRILQQFIIQETNEKVTVTSTDHVRYIESERSSNQGITFADIGSSSRSDGIVTISNSDGQVEFYGQSKPSFNPTISPNNSHASGTFVVIPRDHIFSSSNISSNLAGSGASLMSLAPVDAFTADNHNESLSLPAGNYIIGINATFSVVPPHDPGSVDSALMYLLLVETRTTGDGKDIIDNQPINRTCRYKVFQNDNYHTSGNSFEAPGITPGFKVIDDRITTTAVFASTFPISLSDTTFFTLVPCFEFGLIDDSAGGGVITDLANTVTVPSVKRTNLTLTVTEV